MQVTYELTQRDFFDSFVAHRNRSPITKWVLRLVVTGLMAVGIGGLIVFATIRDVKILSNLFPLFALMIAWAAMLWILPWRTARKQFRGQPAAQGPRTILLDVAGVHFRWNGGSSDVEWKTYIKWLDGKNQILLYSSPACFGIIPKRALDPSQLAELRTLLAQNIKPFSR